MMRKLLPFLLPILLLAGCAVRTVYVPHGTPVRLRETIHDAKVWVKDSGGKPVAGRMDRAEAERRIAAQEPMLAAYAKADEILRNDGDDDRPADGVDGVIASFASPVVELRFPVSVDEQQTYARRRSS